jgi:hypothetical protein
MGHVIISLHVLFLCSGLVDWLGWSRSLGIFLFYIPIYSYTNTGVQVIHFQHHLLYTYNHMSTMPSKHIHRYLLNKFTSPIKKITQNHQ